MGWVGSGLRGPPSAARGVFDDRIVDSGDALFLTAAGRRGRPAPPRYPAPRTPMTEHFRVVNVRLAWSENLLNKPITTEMQSLLRFMGSSLVSGFLG